MHEDFAAELLKVRHARTAAFPSKRAARRFADHLVELLFPHLSAEAEYFTGEEIEGRLALLGGELRKLLRPLREQLPQPVESIVQRFFAVLPDIYRKLWLDAEAMFEGDPAAESLDEVIAAYPGFFAVYTYRIAHQLYNEGVPILPRILTEHAHLETGIDIHPGATIGESFCIDHGTGVVIGETTRIGDRVKLYQGVSLGALSVSKEQAKEKRHPTVEDDVVIYGSATILGGKTTIGHDSVVGGNVWLTKSVDPWSVVYHNGTIRVRSKNEAAHAIEFHI